MSPTRKSTLQVAGQAVARQSDQRRREVDRGDLGPALRRFQRQHAGAASGVQQTQAAQVVGQPVQQGAAHPVAAFADGRPDAADRRVAGQA